MAWMRCEVCKQNFFNVKSSVCPNHVGHVMHLIPSPAKVLDEVPMSPLRGKGEEGVEKAPARAVPMSPFEIDSSEEPTGEPVLKVEK